MSAPWEVPFLRLWFFSVQEQLVHGSSCLRPAAQSKKGPACVAALAFVQMHRILLHEQRMSEERCNTACSMYLHQQHQPNQQEPRTRMHDTVQRLPVPVRQPSLTGWGMQRRKSKHHKGLGYMQQLRRHSLLLLHDERSFHWVCRRWRSRWRRKPFRRTGRSWLSCGPNALTSSNRLSTSRSSPLDSNFYPLSLLSPFVLPLQLWIMCTTHPCH